jgi:hypothetical protein
MKSDFSISFLNCTRLEVRILFVVLSDSSICKNTANLQLLGRRRGGGGTVQNLESKLALQISGTDHEFNKLEVVTKPLD